MDIEPALRLAVPLVFAAEGCRLTAYLDRLAKAPVWTIGHGTTFVAG
jgi:GH24 family phage-related lysozyme (muramidase)